MEAENAQLKSELASKDVVIYVQAQQDIVSSFLGGGFERRPIKIGYISSSGDFYKQPDYESTLNTIRSDIEFQVRERNEYKILNTKDEANVFKKELCDIMEQIEQNQKALAIDNRHIREQKSDFIKLITEERAKINSLPRIVKWIFGIKNM